jgi:hypothetical protein
MPIRAGLQSLELSDWADKARLMGTTASNKIICRTAAVVTGLIALSAYAGVGGLLGGGISFGETIDARLPFGSLILAGLALLAIVAVPMTVAAMAAAKGTQRGPDLVFAAGLLLVVWIGVELAFIKAYSWFHPTYLAAAVVVLGLGWLMDRHGSARLAALSRRLIDI